MKTRLLNDIMIYENNDAISACSELVKKFSTLWKNDEVIDVLKNH